MPAFLTKLLGFKVYAYVAAGAFLAGFAWGWHLEAQRFAEFRGGVEALGRAAEQARLAKIANDKRIQKEVEDARKTEIARRDRELHALRDRLHQHARSRPVRPPVASAPEPVRPSDTPAPGVACYDLERLNAGLRESYDRLLGRLGEVVQRSADALDDARWWGEWARKVGACQT